MAITYVDYTATGGQTDFDFTFPYLEDEHIKVEINGAETTDFTIVATPSTKVVLDPPGATAGANVRVRRRSAPNQNLVDFVNGSVLTESELDLAYRHNRYLSEEIAELNDQSLQKESGGTEWDALGLRIQNVGTATDTTDAVTKLYVDNKVAQVSSGATQPPLKWVFSAISGTNNTYTVTGAEVLGDTAYEVSIDGLIKEPTVEYTVDPDTDTLTIIPNMTGGEDIVVIQRGFGVAVTGTVGTNSLVDGSVTTPKLAAGAVTSNKISTTDTNFNVQSDGKVGIGTATPDQSLSVNGAIESIKDRISGTPEGGQIILRSQEADGYRWNIDNYSFAGGGGGGSLFRLWKADEQDGANGVTYFTIDPTTGYVNIGSGVAATHALDVTGDLNITGDYKVNGTNLQTVPTGTVSAFAGSAAPTGYLLCDGSAVNTYARADLHAVISGTYGGTDYVAGVTDQPGVTTTFNLPNLKGYVIAGAHGTLLPNNSVGKTGGSGTHTLTSAQSGMPSHNVSVAIPAGGSYDGGYPSRLTESPTNNGNLIVTASVSGVPATAAHNNVQPTLLMNYIIKY